MKCELQIPCPQIVMMLVSDMVEVAEKNKEAYILLPTLNWGATWWRVRKGKDNGREQEKEAH